MEVDHPKVYISQGLFLISKCYQSKLNVIYSQAVATLLKFKLQGTDSSIQGGVEHSTGWRKLALDRLVLQKLTHAIKRSKHRRVGETTNTNGEVKATKGRNRKSELTMTDVFKMLLHHNTPSPSRFHPDTGKTKFAEA